MPCPSLHCTCASMQVVSPWWLPGGISRFSAHFPPPPYICDLVLQQDFRPSTSKKSQVSTLCTPRARIWSSIHHISPGNIPRCGNPTSERANGCSGNRKAAPRSFTNFWREATATFETLGSPKATLKGEVWGVALCLCSSFLRVVVPDFLRPLSHRLLLVYIYVLVSLPFKKKTSYFHQPAWSLIFFSRRGA